MNHNIRIVYYHLMFDWLPVAVVLKEQYQFLYRAMLSLIGTQEDEKTLQSSDNNGTIVVGTASTAESLESLV